MKNLHLIETLEEAAKRLYQKGLKDDLSLSFHDGVKFGAKWQAERMLAFINDEDNHTEGELGNSCIDVQTLVNFINQKII